MYFENLDREEKIKRVTELVSRLTRSQLNEDQAASILDAFESFESFVYSGKTFLDLQEEAAAGIQADSDILGVVGSFSDFLVNRGAALAQNEVWILMSFLFWTQHCMALTGKEASLVKELKAQAHNATRHGVFRMNEETKQALQALLTYWTGEVR